MTRLSQSLVPALLVGLAATASAQNQDAVDFASGSEGWSINGLEQIDATGGNPDEYLSYPAPIDNFGIAVRSSAGTSPAFLGDYAAKGDVRLSIDMQVDSIQNFGFFQSRELVVILYDDDQQGPSGPAAVWTSLGVLIGQGQPWTSYSADITDATSDALPAGWFGRGDEDPNTFEPILPPGATWANVLAGVDRVEFTTFVPGFFFGFAFFDVAADNIAIEPLDGGAWTDLGEALAGVSGEPELTGTGTLAAGSLNGVSLSNAAGASTVGLFVGLSRIDAPFKGGTLVPMPDVLVLTNTDAAGELSVPFNMPVATPSGVSIYVQAGIQDAAAPVGVALSNAIEGVTP